MSAAMPADAVALRPGGHRPKGRSCTKASEKVASRKGRIVHKVLYARRARFPQIIDSFIVISGATRQTPMTLIRTSIRTAIATIITFSVSDTKPSGTLLSPPTQAHLISRLSM
jgi:hypothetical protein